MAGVLAGKVAIVTGGRGNLGKLFAEALARDGADIVTHYNSPRRADEAAALVAELEAQGVNASSHQGDLTDLAEITKLVAVTTVDRFGHWHTSSSTPPGSSSASH